MAQAIAHQHRYLIKDLDTTSVTLSPSTATVVRELSEVSLKPGSNEITLYGLTPTTEEHSVQISGQGTAHITDLSVELVPNNDRSDLVTFSDTDDDDDDDEGEDDSSDEDDAGVSAADRRMRDDKDVELVDEAIQQLRQRVAEHREEMKSTTLRIGFLDEYGKALRPKDCNADEVVKYLALYETERRLMFHRHQSCESGIGRLHDQLERKLSERRKVVQAKQKERKKAKAQQKKEAFQKAQAKADQRAEKLRLKEQVMAFWPKKVYKVVLTVEAPAEACATPAASEAGDSATPATPEPEPEPAPAPHDGAGTLPISLSFSYVTRDACWCPSYNIQLSTLTRSGSLAYRAEFENRTSKTWRHASLMLSTSHASSGGLSDAIPTLVPWPVRLAKRGMQFGAGSGAELNAGLESKHEKLAKTQTRTRGALFGAAPATDRGDLFGAAPVSAPLARRAQAAA
ncbi:MAG: hypothetical protein M1826_005660, partial [Phylliscum demangeonii]